MPSDRKQVQRLRTQLGMVFQSFNLWQHMTILQNVIEVPVHVLGKSKDEATATGEALLRRVGLFEKRRCLSRLSLRRPAAACGDCPRACDPAAGYAVRRADLGARSAVWSAKC